jgi:hypothetical protein
MKNPARTLLKALTLTAFAATASLMLCSSAFAATIVDDKFIDGGFTNGADAKDISWYATGGDLSVVSDQTTGPDEGVADNALNRTAATFSGALGSFASTTLAIGETMTLSFNLDFTATPGTNSGGLRFGLYNSNGSPVAGNSNDPNNDFGYRIALPTNQSSAPVINREAGTNASIGTGNDAVALATPGSFSNINIGATTNNYSFSITRGASTNTFGLSLNGTSIALTAIEDANITTFDEIYIGTGNISTAFCVDNVLLTVVSTIPEPSTYASLVGFGVLGLAVLRRRNRVA